MKQYYISEVYDGRLPQYEVVEVESKITKILKTFDSEEEAEEYIKHLQ